MNSRRTFLKQALGATLVTAAAPMVCACGSKVFAMGEPTAEPMGTIQIKKFLTTYPALKNVDGSAVYHPPSPNQYKPIVLTCSGTSPYTFIALTAVCTHQGVTVNAYSKSSGYIYCSGHGSHFSKTGAVLQGPASRPLTSYTTSYDETNDILSITNSGLTDGVNDSNSLALELGQNYPNPVTGRTTISFVLPEACQVQLSVTDLNGSELASLHEGFLSAGQHAIEFNAAALAAGVYFYRLSTPHGTLVKQMVKQ